MIVGLFASRSAEIFKFVVSEDNWNSVLPCADSEL